jgi:succinyl-diaminopimelate desuccinylase
VLPEYDLARVKQKVLELGENAARRFGVSLTVEPVQELPSAPPTPLNAPVVKALERAIREVYDREAQPRGIGGGTVAAFLRQQGLAAAVWMTVSQTAHQPNEFSLLSNLLGDARVLAHVFLEE